jgi:hypothetical protein
MKNKVFEKILSNFEMAAVVISFRKEVSALIDKKHTSHVGFRKTGISQILLIGGLMLQGMEVSLPNFLTHGLTQF